MKKILLASTALVAFAGAAAANDNISLSGSAKMAVVGGQGDVTVRYTDVTDPANTFRVKESADTKTPTQFFQDVDVSFAMSAETDGGLTFGTKVDLDEATKLGNEFDDQGVAIYVSGEFGTVTLGDTDSAMDAVLLDGDELAGGLGSINDANTVHLGFNGSYLTSAGDDQRLSYAYNWDAFKFVVSLEQGPTGANGVVLDGDDDLTWSIGAGYDWAFGGGVAMFGLAYTHSDNGSIQFEASDAALLFTDDVYVLSGEAEAWGVSAAVALDGGFTGGLTYVQYDFKDFKNGDLDYLALGLAYSWEEFGIGLNWGQYDNDDIDFNGWGLAMAYDLGGGLEVQAGYGYSDATIDGLSGTLANGTDYNKGKVESTFDQWSLGLSMSF